MKRRIIGSTYPDRGLEFVHELRPRAAAGTEGTNDPRVDAGASLLDIASTIIYTSRDFDMTTAAEPTKSLPLIACCVPLTKPALSDEQAEATAAIFQALSDPARVKIINLLAGAEEPVCQCELTPALDLAQSTVSHHLKKLTHAGLLEREQRSKWAYYALSREAIGRLASLVDFKEAIR
jgi:ArsR family transcriptional regulator